MLHNELYATCINFFFCDCISCVANGRVHELDEDEANAYAGLPRCTSCAFKKWFEEFIEEMDMDVCYDGNDDGYFWFDGADDDDVVWSWGYGSKLVQAPSVSSPHLRKLEWAFQILYSMRNPS